MKFVNVLQNKNVYADGFMTTQRPCSCLDEAKDGGTVYFPYGTYILSASLIFYSHQHLVFSDYAVMLRSETKRTAHTISACLLFRTRLGQI